MKAEINKHGCLVLTTTTALEEKQLANWLKNNSGVVMNYAVDVNSEVNGVETRKDKCTLHIVSNNEVSVCKHYEKPYDYCANYRMYKPDCSNCDFAN